MAEFRFRRMTSHTVDVSLGNRTLMICHKLSRPEITDVYAYVNRNGRMCTRSVDMHYKVSKFTKAAIAALVKYLSEGEAT